MSFPDTVRDIRTELFLGGDWVDVTDDVRGDDGITIQRGRRNETGRPEPTHCTFTIKNSSGNYAPRNPNGIWYGQLGRNTPVRHSIGQWSATFGGTVVNGWGVTTTGQTWTLTGAASSWAENGGTGRRSLAAASTYAAASLLAAVARDIDVTATFTLPFTDVTGAPIRMGLFVRADSDTDYYEATIAVTTTETIQVGVIHYDGTVIAPLTTVTGLTHTAAQSLTLRCQTEGHTVRIKAWAAGSAEPFGWHSTGNSDLNVDAGYMGVFFWPLSGNTNTYPFTITVDNFVARWPRFSGELSHLAQRWDISGNDVRVPVEAAGVLRRLGQGAGLQQSTTFRAIMALATPPVAYWPAEVGSDATGVSSALGGPAMTVSGVTTDFASYTSLASTAPLPVLGVDSTWVGTIPKYTSTGTVMLRFILHAPTSEIASNALVIAVQTAAGSTGTMSWDLKYQTGGKFSLEMWKNGTNILNTGPLTLNLINVPAFTWVELVQSGGDITWELGSFNINTTSGLVHTGTVVSQTLQAATRVLVAPFQNVVGPAIGHIHVRKEIANPFDMYEELQGFPGETAGNRIQRLCQENGLSLSYIGDLDDTEPVGPQRVDILVNLLHETADADMGTLYEPRGETGIAYRTGRSLYNQDVTATINYNGGQIGPPFDPVDDDQLTRNVVVATRRDGGHARAELIDGRMSTKPPDSGGVGEYSTEATLNVHTDAQLDNIATWLMHAGTVDDTRYPTVVVNLHNRNVANDAVLSLAAEDVDVDDRFSIVSPKAGQTPDNIDQISRGMTEWISNYQHSIAINGAPGQTYQVIRLNGGAGHPSKLNTGGSTLTSSVTTTGTSLSVTFTDGRWTTTAGEMPISIRVGGEVMSVTAISGTTSPQTFTVTRSVNGIVKAHTAGTVVTLTKPAVLAR